MYYYLCIPGSPQFVYLRVKTDNTDRARARIMCREQEQILGQSLCDNWPLQSDLRTCCLLDPLPPQGNCSLTCQAGEGALLCPAGEVSLRVPLRCRGLLRYHLSPLPTRLRSCFKDHYASVVKNSW